MNYKEKYIKIYNILIGGSENEIESEMAKLLGERGFPNTKYTVVPEDKTIIIVYHIEII